MKCLVQLVGITLAAATLAWCQTTINSSITDPRPLAKAAEILEIKLGIPINYEDPEYTHNSDIKDVTASVTEPLFRQAHPEHRVLIPSGGSLDIRGPSITATSPQAGALSLVQTLIGQHNARSNPGTFQVRQTGQRLQIVPTAVKGKDGTMALSGSVLDASIAIPEREWTGLQLVDFICQAVSAATGKKVVSGMVPQNLLYQTTVRLGADNEPARGVLLRAFAALAYKQPVSAPIPQMSWQLFYAPDAREYVLNIHVVQTEKPGPFGGTTLQTLTR